MNVGFGTVVYKSAMEYCDEFIQSLNEQSYKDFQLVVINDDLEYQNLLFFKESIKVPVNIYTPKSEHNIPYLRVDLLIYAKQIGIDLLIIGDFDDEHDSNRVKLTVEQYDSNYAFYYNDIVYFDETPYFNHLPDETNSIEMLLQKNYLGMSNTAIDLRKLSFEYLESLKKGKTNIFDWYLYSKLLIDGYVGKKVSGTNTKYRIHGQNIIGQQRISEAQIRKEISVKLEHYEFLKDLDLRFARLIEQYKLLQDHDEEIELYRKRDNNYWWGYIQVEE